MNSVAFFEQLRFSFDNLTLVVFWAKVELSDKNPLKRSSSQIAISESTQKQLEIHDGTKNKLNTLSHKLLGRDH